jgi:hypothetical protein
LGIDLWEGGLVFFLLTCFIVGRENGRENVFLSFSLFVTFLLFSNLIVHVYREGRLHGPGAGKEDGQGKGLGYHDLYRKQDQHMHAINQTLNHCIPKLKKEKEEKERKTASLTREEQPTLSSADLTRFSVQHGATWCGQAASYLASFCSVPFKRVVTCCCAVRGMAWNLSFFGGLVAQINHGVTRKRFVLHFLLDKYLESKLSPRKIKARFLLYNNDSLCQLHPCDWLPITKALAPLPVNQFFRAELTCIISPGLWLDPCSINSHEPLPNNTRMPWPSFNVIFTLPNLNFALGA